MSEWNTFVARISPPNTRLLLDYANKWVRMFLTGVGPKAEVINAFRNLFKKNVFGNDLILIIILDEIDILLKNDGDGLLYTLTRTENVSIASISNFVDFKQFIKPRVRSSLRDRGKIVFPPYNAQQLVDILKERSKLSFR